MSWLLDVNLLLAWGWESHLRHSEAGAWLDALDVFHTCPIVELGFLRVSMSPGFQATLADAKAVLESLTGRATAKFIPDSARPVDIADVASHRYTTDAYLVKLAGDHGLKLATLDESLCRMEWAAGIAEIPF
jgi:toxin-antitoxin system PIN domain toxin